MPLTSEQRFWYNTANEAERLEQRAEERDARKRQRKSQDNRNFNRSLGELEASYNRAINDANNTRDKRRLKKERDARIDTEIAKREKANNPTSKNATIGDDGTDQTGGNPENGDGGSADAGSGLPTGFNEETLDVVNNDNTAGQRVFLTKAV